MNTLPDNWQQDAEANDFDVTKVWSFAHFIAENSYGFTSTHPNWSEEKFVQPLQQEMLAYHGPEAARTIQTLVDLWGCEELFDKPSVKHTERDLLLLAMVQSAQHRKVCQ